MFVSLPQFSEEKENRSSFEGRDSVYLIHYYVICICNTYMIWHIAHFDKYILIDLLATLKILAWITEEIWMLAITNTGFYRLSLCQTEKQMF